NNQTSLHCCDLSISIFILCTPLISYPTTGYMITAEVIPVKSASNIIADGDRHETKDYIINRLPYTLIKVFKAIRMKAIKDTIWNTPWHKGMCQDWKPGKEIQGNERWALGRNKAPPKAPSSQYGLYYVNVSPLFMTV
ncbi:MAG: hypothetical protein QME27_02250, partial [Syntrophaceae bacterium]|nr:hypothetical protein [Syntrophaceae bacterium]